MSSGLKLYTEGACFGTPTKKNFNKRKNDTSQFPLQKLKFYLAFENGYHCNDYISEKFWRNSLAFELVPGKKNDFYRCKFKVEKKY